jgi:LAGLIDADG DNA endonuclease family/NUMOD3 motif
MIKNCELCKLEFLVNEKRKRDREKRFCSLMCAKKYIGTNNKGKKRTEVYKKELSEKLKGEGNPFYGKKHKDHSKKLIGIANKWSEKDFVYVNFTQEQKEIFDGIMISDGSLEHSNISARITLGFKYKETIERIINDLNNMDYCPVYEHNYVDKRTGNKVVNFFTKSHFNRTLFNEYYRWYNDNIKIIPRDIQLTPLFCYWWYVMDGFILDETIYLCTDSYKKKDLIFLKEMFKKIYMDCTITARNRLRFNKKETIKYFNYIKDIKIQKEYEYKFTENK